MKILFFGTLYSWVETSISLLVLGSSGVEKNLSTRRNQRVGFYQDWCRGEKKCFYILKCGFKLGDFYSLKFLS